MADIFQTVGTAGAVAELSFRLYNEISGFVARVRTVDNVAKELVLKVKRLENCLKNVQSTSRARAKQLRQDTGYRHRKEEQIWSNEEEQVWSTIHESLEQWQETLSSFRLWADRLPGPSVGQTKLNWLEKTFLQLKLDREASKVAGFEDAIQSHVDVITVSLNCIGIFVHSDTSSRIGRLEKMIETLMTNTTRGNRYTSINSAAAHETKSMRRIQSICISLANFFGEKPPMCNPPEGQGASLNLHDEAKYTMEHEECVADQGNVRSGETDILHSNEDQDSADDNDIVPAFDVTRPRDLLDRLISEYKAQVEIEVAREEYNDAIDNQRRATECVMERKEVFLQSVQLLIDILELLVYELQHDKVAVRIYREMYLKEPAAPSTLTTMPEEFNFNSQDHTGNTYLVSAIIEGDVSKVQQMLQHGADPNRISQNNKSPLMYAVDRGDDSLVTLLKNRGAHINAEFAGKTALHYAVSKQSAHMVEVLIQHGAYIEASSDKYTPLLRAAQLGQPEIVRTLCQSRAKVNATCPYKLTSLHWAVYGQEKAVQKGQADVDDFHEVVRILLRSQADVNAVDGEGKTPLHYAVERGDEDSARVLLETSSALDLPLDLGAKDQWGRTPLDLAIKDQRYELVSLLLGKGAPHPENPPSSPPPPLKSILRKHSVGSAQGSRSATSASKGTRRSSEPQKPRKWPISTRSYNT